MVFKVPALDFKGTVENFKGTVESLLARRRPAEYVDHDSEPPAEWREAVRPSGSTVSRLDTTGIEVMEHVEAAQGRVGRGRRPHGAQRARDDAGAPCPAIHDGGPDHTRRKGC